MLKDKKQPKNKSYTARQLNEIIYDIMINKKKINSKKSIKPLTMEEFIFDFYKQKYGLNDLAIAEINLLIKYINQLYMQSTEINIFKKILASEIDEKFYWLAQKMKHNFKEKMVELYREKMAFNCTTNEANVYAQSKVNSYLNKEEALGLYKKCYNEQERRDL